MRKHEICFFFQMKMLDFILNNIPFLPVNHVNCNRSSFVTIQKKIVIIINSPNEAEKQNKGSA